MIINDMRINDKQTKMRKMDKQKCDYKIECADDQVLDGLQKTCCLAWHGKHKTHGKCVKNVHGKRKFQIGTIDS